jgi:hypothetical protein
MELEISHVLGDGMGLKDRFHTKVRQLSLRMKTIQREKKLVQTIKVGQSWEMEVLA